MDDLVKGLAFTWWTGSNYGFVRRSWKQCSLVGCSCDLFLHSHLKADGGLRGSLRYTKEEGVDPSTTLILRRTCRSCDKGR